MQAQSVNHQNNIQMEEIKFTPVGKVAGNPAHDFDTPLAQLKSETSRLIIDPQYQEALLNIGECRYIEVFFYLDRLKDEPAALSGKTRSGLERGVFASRSPRRPNRIGATTVRLLEVNGNELTVEGLDALDNTPVLDIKCCDTSLFAANGEAGDIHQSLLKADPRMDILNDIAMRRADKLLLRAGQLHGHLCPGLAMGVMASLYAIDYLKIGISEMDHLRVIAEVRNCLTDGVQFVTSCTFAKKDAFIYRESADVAFTFYTTGGKGIRIRARDDSPDVIRASAPESDKAFGTLRIPFEQLFHASEVAVE
jgi:formylmethanofuran dehydrogenase subunit E